MDEFFAAVERLDNPALAGKPIIVGGSAQGRGVVSTASYEARAFGVHSAMPMVQAVRRCPQAVFLPVRMARYAELSRRVFDLFEQFTPLIEPLSIDEAFLDLSGTERLHGPAVEAARRLRATIREQTGLVASVGVAPNKFLAKLASDLEKPDGLTVITPDNVDAVLTPLGVRKLWHVGPKTAEQLERLGIATVGQLRAASVEWLRARFGEIGEGVWQLAWGRDARPVTPDAEARGLGSEQTFAEDVADSESLRMVLLGQVEQVAGRLRRHDLRARTVVLKLRTGDFVTRTRSRTVAEPTCLTDELWAAARGLFDEWAARTFRPLRLLGMAATNLDRPDGRQLSLFDHPHQRRGGRLDRAVDAIRNRFGPDALRRGGRSR